MAENLTGQKLKIIHTDNGGEYTAKKFENYLKAEGIQYVQTVPRVKWEC